MAKGLRACPICPSCGSKKFKIIDRSSDGMKVIVQCISCSKQIPV